MISDPRPIPPAARPGQISHLSRSPFASAQSLHGATSTEQSPSHPRDGRVASTGPGSPLRSVFAIKQCSREVSAAPILGRALPCVPSRKTKGSGLQSERNSLRTLATLTTLLAACTTPATGEAVHSLWCTASGDKLLIEATELADFQGTICRFPGPIPDTATLDTEAQCDRLALTGFDGLEVTDTRSARITARRTANTLELTLAPNPNRTYSPCET